MVNLKSIKRPIIVHYARTPIGSNPSQVLGLYVFDNDKLNSFVPKSLKEEFLAIYDFKRMVEQLISEGGTIVNWCQTTTEFGYQHLNNRFHELTGNSLGLDYGSSQVNLSYQLMEMYGDGYADHPRLNWLAERNSFLGNNNDVSPIYEQQRAMLIMKIFYAARNGTLKHKSTEYREKLLKKEMLKQLNNELHGTDSKERVMNRRELLVELNISVETLNNWIKHKKIPFTKIGRRNYFLKSEILKLK